MAESISSGRVAFRDLPPLDRIHAMGARGLIVGRGSRAVGGLRSDVAERLAAEGTVSLRRDDRLRPVHAAAAQLDLFR